MQGAKGVIISIIGGDDMKLLEVDEAANHIRELVDPNANIIWGSAFNPDLQGKIRVSVVATGIEQSAEMAEIAARPLSLTASRGPIRPTIAPPAPVAPPSPPAAPAEPDRVEVAEAPVSDSAASASSTGAESEIDALELTEEDGDAVADDGGAKGGYGSLAGVRTARAEPLDLGLEQVDEVAVAKQDELLLDASRLAEEDGPVSPLVTRRRSAAPAGGAPAAGSAARPPVAGNTLFERMANLSRGVKPAAAEDEDEDEDDGSAISIPRFLGRQNNQ
jgi:cell division protein FtsZ